MCAAMRFSRIKRSNLKFSICWLGTCAPDFAKQAPQMYLRGSIPTLLAIQSLTISIPSIHSTRTHLESLLTSAMYIAEAVTCKHRAVAASTTAARGHHHHLHVTLQYTRVREADLNWICSTLTYLTRWSWMLGVRAPEPAVVGLCDFRVNIRNLPQPNRAGTLFKRTAWGTSCAPRHAWFIPATTTRQHLHPRQTHTPIRINAPCRISGDTQRDSIWCGWRQRVCVLANRIRALREWPSRAGASKGIWNRLRAREPIKVKCGSGFMAGRWNWSVL